MIHFTCDGCHRSLDSECDTRYIVRVEVYEAVNSTDEDLDDDRDHLEELQEMMEELDDLAADLQVPEDAYQLVRYDLCSECRRKFLRNPLGRGLAPQLNFSQN